MNDSLVTTDHHSLLKRYAAVRSLSDELVSTLETEDFVVQSMPDVSPTRWHLAHTTWFFETFLLAKRPDYESSNPSFEYLFNSYYNLVGKQFPRAQRGHLTRPTVKEVFAYRLAVDEAMESIIGSLDAEDQVALEIGIHHEQQHQELMLTDIKHVFGQNPLHPRYVQEPATLPERGKNSTLESTLGWAGFDGGVVEVGHDGDEFAFDNESPRFETLLPPYSLANRLVTCGEYLEFMRDDGYRRPEFWLSMGWSTVQSQGWEAPLYWFEHDGKWWEFTLRGLEPVERDRPVTHVSYFEADAYARWSGRRLPTEFEWEHAANSVEVGGNFVDAKNFHPLPSGPGAGLKQMYGDVWEWTSSQYSPYPGYAPPPGALGEYNGKFMCNQFVLRGGSCATSLSHIRPSYRNFFPPDARWQFSGIRLAS